MRHILLLALVTTATPAMASGETMNAFGPYDVNPALTTGEATGFRQVFIDPSEFGSLVEPTEALGEDADDTLHVQNRTNAWTELSINGVRIGIIGPLTTVSLQGVKPGTYATTQLGPTGMMIARTFKSDRYETMKAAEEVLAAQEVQAAQEAEVLENTDETATPAAE